MAHLQFTDESTRLELNLSGPEVPGVVEFLLGLISARVESRVVAPDADAAALRRYPPTVEAESGLETLHVAGYQPEPEPVDDVSGIPDSGPGPEPADTPPSLLPRTCQRHGCEAVFQPFCEDHVYCSRQCKTKVANAKAAAKRREQAATAATAGAFPCAEPGCGQSFPTAAALGGHKGGHVRAQTPGPAPFTKAAGTTGRADPHPSAKRTPGRETPPNGFSGNVTLAEDRPFRCKAPGCGHPCRSQGELNSHRIAYHQGDQGIPPVTTVLASMSFPCPVADCERHTRPYDDSTKLDHHRKVIHDPPAPVAHVVEAHGLHHAERVG